MDNQSRERRLEGFIYQPLLRFSPRRNIRETQDCRLGLTDLAMRANLLAVEVKRRWVGWWGGRGGGLDIRWGLCWWAMGDGASGCGQSPRPKVLRPTRSGADVGCSGRGARRARRGGGRELLVRLGAEEMFEAHCKYGFGAGEMAGEFVSRDISDSVIYKDLV